MHHYISVRLGVLFGGVVIAAFLRLFQLDSIPPSLNWDEVAIGWNANTIFHARRDEFGKYLPLTFQSFGDYKAPFYIYATAPFVGLFGMNPWTVRLPSALSGIILVLVLYFFSKKIGEKLGYDQTEVAILSFSTFVFSIFSIWFIFFSRGGFELNLACFFLVSGLWLFLLGLDYPYLWIGSLSSFILSMYTYHSTKIVVPLLSLIILYLFFYEIKQVLSKQKNVLIICLLLSLLLLIPLINVNLFEQGSSRIKGSTILFDLKDQLVSFDIKLVSTIVKNYLVHFAPDYYLGPTNTTYRTGLQHSGFLTPITYGVFLIGIGSIFINKGKNKYGSLLIAWYLIALLPSVLSKDIMPYSLRAFNTAPVVLVLSSIGVVAIFKFISSLVHEQKLKNPVIYGVFLVGGVLFFYQSMISLKEYVYEFPLYSAPDWQYGYKEVMQKVRPYEDSSPAILITKKHGEPHVFAYFFQNRPILDVYWGGMIKYWFQDINWEKDQNLSGYTLVGTAEEIPPQIDPAIGSLEEEIRYPNGDVAFRIVNLRHKPVNNLK